MGAARSPRYSRRLRAPVQRPDRAPTAVGARTVRHSAGAVLLLDGPVRAREHAHRPDAARSLAHARGARLRYNLDCALKVGAELEDLRCFEF